MYNIFKLFLNSNTVIQLLCICHIVIFLSVSFLIVLNTSTVIHFQRSIVGTTSCTKL